MVRLKERDKIQHKLPGTEEWTTATALRRAGKATGKNRNWYNVEDCASGREQKSLDLDQIEWKTSNEGENEHVQITENDSTLDCKIAKQAELQKLSDF